MAHNQGMHPIHPPQTHPPQTPILTNRLHPWCQATNLSRQTARKSSSGRTALRTLTPSRHLATHLQVRFSPVIKARSDFESVEKLSNAWWKQGNGSSEAKY